MIRILALISVLLLTVPAAAQQMECAALADQVEFEHVTAAGYGAKIIELDAGQIVAFNTFLGGAFSEIVDIVTLFVFPDGHSEFNIGSNLISVKCSRDDFVFSPDETRQMMSAVFGDAV